MSECFLWPGPGTNGGYGRITVAGRTYYVHRWIWIQLNGPIPDGCHVHHICRNKSCINPDHWTLIADTSQHFNLHRREDGLAGIAKIHAGQKTCKNGHPFDGHDGRQRTCSICARAIKARYQAQHVEEHRERSRARMRHKLNIPPERWRV